MTKEQFEMYQDLFHYASRLEDALKEIVEIGNRTFKTESELIAERALEGQF